jgi:hypothetical protein
VPAPIPRNLPSIEALAENLLKSFADIEIDLEYDISKDCIFLTSFDTSSVIIVGLSFMRTDVGKRSTFLMCCFITS